VFIRHKTVKRLHELRLFSIFKPRTHKPYILRHSTDFVYKYMYLNFRELPTTTCFYDKTHIRGLFYSWIPNFP